MKTVKVPGLVPVTLSMMPLLILMLNTAGAQNPSGNVLANNAVWSSSSLVGGSVAFIDASAFCGQNGTGNCGGGGFDFCTTLSSALKAATTAGGGIVDARGIVNPPTAGGGGGQLSCGSDPFSLANISQGNTIPITVLLPAAPIKMGCTWMLPSNIRLVGQGAATMLEDVASGFCTTSACSTTASCNSPSALIQFGSANCPNKVCSGISVEHLKLNQTDTTLDLNGIINSNAQQSSYVDDVQMSNFVGTGLLVGADGSGPYTNIAFTSVSGSGCSGPATSRCVDLEAQSQGLRGVTCLGNSTTATQSAATPGITVNASNNSLKDLHVESFWDGVEIGDISSTTPVANIVISNITGTASANCPGLKVGNTVHICAPSSTGGACLSVGASVSNVSVLQATNGSTQTNTIRDDVLGVVVGSCGVTGCGLPLTTAEYTLGANQVASTGSLPSYPLFATNPANSAVYGGSSTPVVTWGVGGNTTLLGQTCYTPGALYSSSLLGSAGNSVYVCTTTSGGGSTWQSIP